MAKYAYLLTYLDTDNHLRKPNDYTIKGFDPAGKTEAIKFANVLTRVQNPFEQHRQQPFVIVFVFVDYFK